MAEHREALNDSIPFVVPSAWAGGYFETAGTMAFHIQRRIRRGEEYVISSAIISSAHSREAYSERLAELFGGRVYRIATNSWDWKLLGRRAIEFGLYLASFAPSRREITSAFYNWSQSETEEKVRIAEEVKGFNRLAGVTYNDYSDLGSVPGFLAGVIDARATFYLNFAKGGIPNPQLQIDSANNLLLEKLQESFGGYIKARIVQGESRSIGGASFISKSNSYRWAIGGSPAATVVRRTLPYLELRKNDFNEVIETLEQLTTH